MTKRELYKLCQANGIPPLVYDWNFHQEMGNEYLKKKFTPIFDDIDSFIKGRNCFYIYFDTEPLLASRVGVTFLKAAYISGFADSRYTTPKWIVDFEKERWEQGDTFQSLYKSDFLVIDNVTNKLEPFEQKIFDKFVDMRLMAKRSTIFVGTTDCLNVFSARILYLLGEIGAKEINQASIKGIHATK